jgi:hypothetical protein
MAAATTQLPAGYEEFTVFDRRTNALNRRISYILHFAAVIFFVPLFAAVAAAVRPGRPLDPVDLWAVSVPGVGIIGALAILFFAVVAVLYLHELAHAGVLRFIGGAKPEVSTRRLGISVSSPGWYLPKRLMFASAVLPFFSISALGAVVLAVVPSHGIAWVFIPLVANGVASAGDVMTVSWLLASPKRALFRDAGSSLTVFAPATQPD